MINISEEDYEVLLDFNSLNIDCVKYKDSHSTNEENFVKDENKKIRKKGKFEDSKEAIDTKYKIISEKNINNLLVKDVEKTLTWFSFDNMLQIIEIDPFNNLSLLNIDYLIIQEILNFDNSSIFPCIDEKKNKQIHNKIYLIKEYILDKGNFFYSYLKNPNLFYKENNNREKRQSEKAVDVKFNRPTKILKDGNFLTEIKEVNENDEEINSEKLFLYFKILKNHLETMIMQFTKLEKSIVILDNKLIERSRIYLGDDETNKTILNFGKAHELSYIKHCYDFRMLIKNLINEINMREKARIKYRNKHSMHNINFFYRCLDLTNNKKDNFFKRISIEFPNERKENLLEYNSLVDYLYIFRTRKKIILENYNNEINDLKQDIENIIQESIENFKSSIMESVKIEKFVFKLLRV